MKMLYQSYDYCQRYVSPFYFFYPKVKKKLKENEKIRN